MNNLPALPEIAPLPALVAKIAPDEIAVKHSVRPDVCREYLTVDCPEGWDNVKKLTRKVLLFDGRRFTFTGWNSDRNEAYFVRGLDTSTPLVTAKILNK